MRDPALLQPVFALAAWTGVVLVLIPYQRIRASLRGAVRGSDFTMGESAHVPPPVSQPNRNFMNLLEAPMLFYVVCILLYVGATPSPRIVQLAWLYVALRIAHSAIHLTYNIVLHRFLIFALSNVVLVALWIMAWRALAISA